MDWKTRKQKYIFGERNISFVMEKKNGEGKGGKYILLWRRRRTEKKEEENI